MKKYLNLLFILLVASCSTNEKTEEDLAREVFQCYVSNDDGGFKRLYVNQRDMQALIDNANMPNDIKKNARKRMRLRTAFFRTVSKAGFNYSRMRAYENGVDWNDAEIISISSDKSGYRFFDLDFDDVEKYGIEVKDINIQFISQRDTFEMQLDDCINVPYKGWCMSEDLRIRKIRY